MILKDLVSKQPLSITSEQMKELAEEVYNEAKRNHQAAIAAENKHRKTLNNETFYGKRKPSEQVKASKNMYSMIKWFNLGNLSGLPQIPSFYAKLLLEYIIHVSRAMCYAHKHNCVHGNFNLSKVIAQKVVQAAAPCSSSRVHICTGKDAAAQKTESTPGAQNTALPEQDKHQKHNFYVTNFEPYRVYQILKSFQCKDNYKRLSKVGAMKLDVASVIQMVKVQDLQKFANSIIEIMVGMCEENREVRDENQQEVNKVTKNNLITGGIQMDLIPLNWSKLAESRNIIKILSMLFGPYNTVGNIDIDTSKIFYDVNQIAENTYLINHSPSFSSSSLC